MRCERRPTVAVRHRVSAVLLVLSIGAVSVSPQAYAACPECATAKGYGSDVLGRTGEATGSVNSASAAITAGFASLVTTVELVFFQLSASVRAMSGEVTSEIKRSAKVEQALLDEYNRQAEMRARADYTLRARAEAEEKYGVENLPLNACEDYAQAGALADAGSTYEELQSAVRGYFVQYRKASPVDDRFYRQRMLQYADAADLDLGKSTLDEDEVAQALEWINQAVDPVPVQPINVPDDLAQLSPEAQGLLAETQALNLRLDSAKMVLADQVLLKAPVVEGDTSYQGMLAARVHEGLSPQALDALGTEASQVKLLRTLVRDMQYGTAIQYEQFKSQMAQTRMEALQLAAQMDSERKRMRVHLGGLDVRTKVSR